MIMAFIIWTLAAVLFLVIGMVFAYMRVEERYRKK